ncbi:MAG: DUF1987 domain-containing protein [Microscillaceae bacterium]|nr:DUF1987 domain-containing protein [Microscillaceae bacterium]
MKNIHLKPTQNTPRLDFDFEKGLFEITGVSYPEYAKEFYDPIVNTLEKYALNPPTRQTRMVFKFTYFNTGTNTPLSSIFKALETLAARPDHPVIINWYFETDDDDMRELGEYFQTLTHLPIEIIEIGEIENQSQELFG